jgi:exostosin family protein
LGTTNLKVFIDNSFETPWERARWQKIIGSWDGSSLIICDSMEGSDVILITLTGPKDDYARAIDAIVQSEKYAVQAEKVFVFDPNDRAIGLFPGIYASLGSYLFSHKRHRTGCYLPSFNEFIIYKDPDDGGWIRYLFSFQGSGNSLVRRRLFLTDFGRNDVLIERREPAGGRMAGGIPGTVEDTFWESSPAMMEFKRQYAEVITRSKFVLCPRGYGSSGSYRVFETMRSGRVPVIISDRWVPWSNIEWSKFSLRVREKDIASLPNICLEASGHWVTMALEARKTWEAWFSDRGLAKLIETSILDIRRTRKYPERLLRLFDWPLRRSLAQGRHLALRSYSAARSAMSRFHH